MKTLIAAKGKEGVRGEQGFVLVTALLIMLVLTIIGIAVTNNTSIELQVSGNDKVHKKTFYEAEAGAMLATELLEQNLACATGFKATVPGLADIEGTVRVQERGGNQLAFWTNTLMNATTLKNKFDNPLNSYDAAYPLQAGNLPTQEVGYLYYGGQTSVLPGGALQMAAGYEGKGKSAAQGGVAKMFDIYSQYKGLVNSESVILFGWRHLVGSEGDCNYD